MIENAKGFRSKADMNRPATMTIQQAEVGRNKPAPAGVSGKPTHRMPETVAQRPYSGLHPILNSPLWLPVFALLSLLLFVSAPLQAAVVKATPDRDPVRLNETFNLVFSSEDSVDGDPDFGPLAQDFDLLGQNQGSQVSIVNGKFSKKQEWTLTLSPKRAGSIPIPAIAFGSDSSQPSSVTVLGAGATVPPTGNGGADDESEIKLEVEATPKNPYVQAQVIYTVRVLLRVNLVGADLSEPVAQDALVERLTDDHRYSTTRNGRDYTAIERKFAIFPQKSGLLTLDPLHLTAQVEIPGRSFFARSTRAVQVKSEAVNLQVRPIPAGFTGKHWLPAADVKLDETWPQQPPKVKAGEPLTRTLTLKALGATVGVLPEMSAELPLDPSIKQYPDQPALNEEKSPSVGIASTRQEKAALIPAKPGHYTMPAVEIPWWNTKTDRMEIAKIPETTLTVEGIADLSTQTPPAPALPPVTADTKPTQTSAIVGSPTPLMQDVWFWLALFCGVGWLATALAWVWKSRHAPVSVPTQNPAEPKSSLASARQALRVASASNDPAATRTALLAWASVYWPDQPPGSLAELAGLGGETLAAEIERINRALYSPAGEAWTGGSLWQAIEATEAAKQKGQQKGLDLEPMYR